MPYHTSITRITDGHEYIREEPLETLMVERPFHEVVYLTLRGTLPTTNEGKLFSALLSAAIDHGPGTASGQTTRIAASARASVHTAVAAGILAMGDRHGSAIEPAANFFLTNHTCADIPTLAKEQKAKKTRVPGYGHPFLTVDHRSAKLFTYARELGIDGPYMQFAERYHKALNEISSKQLPLNIDGSMAALLLELGFNPIAMRGVFVIARIPGLVAHAVEEYEQDGPLHRVPEAEILYTNTSQTTV